MEGPDQSHQVVRLIHISVKYNNKKKTHLLYLRNKTKQDFQNRTGVSIPVNLNASKRKEGRIRLLPSYPHWQKSTKIMNSAEKLHILFA